MSYLQSIEPLARENIIDSNTKPVIVHASDQNYYYCKYHIGHGTAYRLLKEFLLVSFLDFWNLRHAECSFIEVLDEHVPPTLGIPKNRFYVPCFGSRKINDSIMLSKLNEEVLLKGKGKNGIKRDIFTLSFFDMVFANEDRHLNNYNILISQSKNEYILYPIDHEACFNHQNIDRELAVLSYQETLIYSPLFKKLFSNNELKDRKELDKIRAEYYFCYQKSIHSIDGVLSIVPESWQVGTREVGARLKSLLTDKWFANCWNEFLLYLQFFKSNTR